MRLSEYVNQHGIDAFTYDDFLFVGSKVSTDPERLILVGGQAIETWGVFFDVLAPTGDRHPLTEDTDWLGGKRDAQWLCGLLGRDSTELQLAGDNDSGSAVGLAFLKRPDGRVLMMDFLRTIVGPTNDEVRRLAVPVKLDGIVLHVLHPLLCLDSRLANLAVLPVKREGNGPLQAEWAIDIIAAYLRRTLLNQAKREVIRACHHVADAAEFRHGRYCYTECKIDPLRAVAPDIVYAIGGRFESDDWPQTLDRIKKKRERWQGIRARRHEVT